MSKGYTRSNDPPAKVATSRRDPTGFESKPLEFWLGNSVEKSEFSDLLHYIEHHSDKMFFYQIVKLAVDMSDDDRQLALSLMQCIQILNAKKRKIELLSTR